MKTLFPAVLLLTTSLMFVTSKKEEVGKDKADVGTVIGIDLGKLADCCCVKCTVSKF